jgi:hypothetical protein
MPHKHFIGAIESLNRAAGKSVTNPLRVGLALLSLPMRALNTASFPVNAGPLAHVHR